ncbi:Uncharacterised protein [Shigella sonnei]|nr:Uncharacterised protein [Shigella sonnei]
MIERRPDPQERPDNMQGKQAHPARRMNSVGMGMVALFGNQIRDVMYRDDSIKNHQKDEDQHSQREIV